MADSDHPDPLVTSNWFKERQQGQRQINSIQYSIQVYFSIWLKTKKYNQHMYVCVRVCVSGLAGSSNRIKICNTIIFIVKCVIFMSRSAGQVPT